MNIPINLEQYYWHFLPKIITAKLIASVMAIVPFLILYIVVRYIFKAVKKYPAHHGQVYIINFIYRVINTIIFGIGVLTLLGTLGLDIRAIVAGLGLTGFAVGFALKDMLANVLAGVMIIFYRPLAVDATISVLGATGKVTNINLRYTTIENSDGQHLIPNSKILSEKVTILKSPPDLDLNL